MAYEPTVWECGETITAEKLNKLEQAVSEASECCETKTIIVDGTWYDDDPSTNCIEFDITGEEAYNAIKSGKQVICHMMMVLNAMINDAYCLLGGALHIYPQTTDTSLLRSSSSDEQYVFYTFNPRTYSMLRLVSDANNEKVHAGTCWDS